MSIPTFPIRVPPEMLKALSELTGHYWADSLALEPYVCDAIRDYISNQRIAASAARNPQVVEDSVQPGDTGYQWKQLFLPHGTKLRSSFGKRPYFAAVDSGVIRSGEQVISPSAFANLQGCGNRNAWKTIWLLFPGSEQWLLACVARSARISAITRLIGKDAAYADTHLAP